MDAVRALGRQPTEPSPSCPGGESCSPVEPVYIESITIDERPA
jgi:hypothetical protein